MDLSGAALLRALTRANPQYGEVSTVVDIGASKVVVATRSGHHLRSVRTTAGAGVEMTRALAQAVGCTFEEAENIKRGMRLPAVERNTVDGYAKAEQEQISPAERILSQSVNMVVDSIAQSIEADAANFGSYTQGVTLCGGTSLLRGVKDRLQRRVGVPVIIGRPWAEVERSRRNAAFFIEGQLDPRVLLSLSTAIGLALWKEPL
jgi:cell division ATPase FtsA